MSEPLKFYIALPGMANLNTDRIIMTMFLENTGKEAVYVNARFAVAPHIGDIRPIVLFNGEELSFGLRVRLPQLKAADFLKLEPGQQVAAGYQLTRGYQLKIPGMYEIAAEYVNEMVPDELKKHPVFVGSILSGTEKMELC